MVSGDGYQLSLFDLFGKATVTHDETVCGLSYDVAKNSNFQRWIGYTKVNSFLKDLFGMVILKWTYN
jgi:hypothetical protein